MPNPTGINPVDDGNEAYYDATEAPTNLTTSPNTAATEFVTPITDTSEAPANLTSSTSTAATEVPNPTGTNPVDDGNETYYDATEAPANLTTSPNTAATEFVTPIYRYF